MIFQMPVPGNADSIERTLLRDEAYVRIRDAILDGTLEPGERLRDADLTRWLGLSRTPVREALARLADDGLVESEPQRYTRVTPLDRRDARDASRVVAALHALAATLAVPVLTRAELDAMRRANRAFDAALRSGHVDAAIAADDAFHAVLVTASQNREIPPALERLMPRLRRLERARFGSLVGRRSVDQHARIVALAAAGDAAGAAAASSENWLTLGALLERTFDDDAGREAT
jgi:DNA-binding GntR family transcriptional regulator